MKRPSRAQARAGHSPRGKRYAGHPRPVFITLTIAMLLGFACTVAKADVWEAAKTAADARQPADSN